MSRTPNFIGERLTEAREARGYNRAQLAEVLGVTRQAVSLYEKGDRTPTIEAMDQAAKALRFPVHRFTRPMPESSTLPFFFRSFAAATKGVRARAKRRADWVKHDICSYLRDFIEIPKENLPRFTVPDNPLEIRQTDIERIATNTRRHWHLGDGPIEDVILLLENNGAIVVQQELGARTLDAFSRWDAQGGRPCFVIGSDKCNAVRARFNAAHELGHMILHRHLRASLVSLPEMHETLEKQAHYFAGAFLMPAPTFGADLLRPSINAFVGIKTRWKVSIGAMIKRAKSIGLLSAPDQKRLFTYRSQRGWALKEPYDDEIEVEKPKLLERGFELLIREGLTTKTSIESAVSLYAEDIESACGLEPGFFGDDVQNFRFPKLKVADPNPPDSYASEM